MARNDDLDLCDDPDFDRKYHFAKKISYVLIVLFLLATSLGYFGRSDFSKRTIETNGVVFEYDRFVRSGAPTTIKFTIEKANPIEAIWLSYSWLQKLKVKNIMPAPESSFGKGDGIEFKFITNGKISLSLEVDPEDTGSLDGEFSRGDSEKVKFSQYSYF